MNKNITICFRAGEDLRDDLEKISKEERRSVSSTIKTILYKYIESRKKTIYVPKDRRHYPRKMVMAPAVIKEISSESKSPRVGTVLDISLSGVQISIPDDHPFELRDPSEDLRISVIFTLPDSKKPIDVLCVPKRIYLFENETKIGAFFIDTDFASNQVLQTYLLS